MPGIETRCDREFSVPEGEIDRIPKVIQACFLVAGKPASDTDSA